MHKSNEVIREVLQENGLHQWELAERLGVSENTLCRKLRKELTSEEKEQFLKAITEK